MASALLFAARKVCGRAFQRPALPYFTAAVKEEQRRLFPSISHGGSSVRRFCSSNSPNLVNNNKHASNTVAGVAEAQSASPSLRGYWQYTMTLLAACYAVVYVENRLIFGPPFWSKEQPDNAGKEAHASEKAE